MPSFPLLSNECSYLLTICRHHAPILSRSADRKEQRAEAAAAAAAAAAIARAAAAEKRPRDKSLCCPCLEQHHIGLPVQLEYVRTWLHRLLPSQRSDLLFQGPGYIAARLWPLSLS